MSTKIQRDVLTWYDKHRRNLPWRSDMPNPYHVWLSEIMLQQTTVPAVIPYFEKFLGLWPRVEDLAAASQDEVMTAWAGLGYYARARNLHKCAQMIASAYGGKFPETQEELIKLPGIGPYTAAAVAAIAFDQPAVPVDGNIERVTARLFAIADPLPKVKKDLHAQAVTMGQGCDRPGDFAQALMDLGSAICAPKSPQCNICPLTRHCLAYQQGIAAHLPARRPKADKPTRYGTVFWVRNEKDDIWIRKRSETGLLGGMYEIPSTAWTSKKRHALSYPFDGEWAPVAGGVQHSFTHFHLHLKAVSVVVKNQEMTDGQFVSFDALSSYALPSLMQKVIQHCMRGVHEKAA